MKPIMRFLNMISYIAVGILGILTTTILDLMNSNIMRKLFLILLLLPLLGFTSCVKQKNCEGGMVGNIYYFENPQKSVLADFLIIGRFIPDEYEDWHFWIKGKYPKNYNPGDSVRVRIILSEKSQLCSSDDAFEVKCIEKFD